MMNENASHCSVNSAKFTIYQIHIVSLENLIDSIHHREDKCFMIEIIFEIAINRICHFEGFFRFAKLIFCFVSLISFRINQTFHKNKMIFCNKNENGISRSGKRSEGTKRRGTSKI